MSSVAHLLATNDPDLLRAWWALVGAGNPILTLNDAVLPGALPPLAVPMVVVVDIAVAGLLPAACRQYPAIIVSDDGADLVDWSGTRVCLSYEDSRKRLGEFLPLLGELSRQTATVDILAKQARNEAVAQAAEPGESTPRDQSEPWDFFENALESLDSRQQLLAEFRRAARVYLRASQAVFFLREEGGFRADRGEAVCAFDDPLVHYFSSHPAVLDGADWPSPPEPSVQFVVRHRLAVWSARMLVPIHEGGRLYGIIALGVRTDGRAYSQADKARAISLARLLRQMLKQSTREIGGGSTHSRHPLPVDRVIPGLVVLSVEEPPPSHVPPAVCALIGEARTRRSSARLTPSAGQPLRASAGFIPETYGVWASWEDATADLQAQLRDKRAERLGLLHDLALTLNHELGNSLVSLAALRHNPGAETNSPVLLAAIKRDIASLEAINRHLASIPTFSEVNPETVDLRALMHAVGRKTGVFVETGADAIDLSVAPRLIEFALEAIIESIAENRPGMGKRNLVLQLRAVTQREGTMARLAIRGDNLALEGILPAPAPGSVPSHGRIGVFIAKEIVRLHGGTIEAGANQDGPEILVSFFNW